MQFIYVLPGWEGSASDARVLRDVVSRTNGLKVPQGIVNMQFKVIIFCVTNKLFIVAYFTLGFYYLCDAGYMNGEGFLAPYRGQMYHLKEWRHGAQPTTPQEYFNMKHSSARNVIERCFGLLKGRWAILRNKSFYPVKTQVRIISACCLLHNHIRKEMPIDPLEIETMATEFDNNEDATLGERITHIETSDAWNTWRDNLAIEMFNAWGGRHS